MPIGIVIAVAVVLIVVAAVISHFLTVSNLKNNAESKIGNAEARAREIIDDAVKTAEAKKKESLLEIKEESIKNKNELEKETKERRSELQRYEKRVLSKEETLDKKSEAIERREAGFTAKEETVNRLMSGGGILSNLRVIAPLIPWSIAGAVPLATINAPTLSLAAATFLYLLPLSRMLASAVRRRSGFRTRHRSQNQNPGLAIPHRPKPMLHMFAHGFHPKSGD